MRPRSPRSAQAPSGAAFTSAAGVPLTLVMRPKHGCGDNSLDGFLLADGGKKAFFLAARDIEKEIGGRMSGQGRLQLAAQRTIEEGKRDEEGQSKPQGQDDRW